MKIEDFVSFWVKGGRKIESKCFVEEEEMPDEKNKTGMLPPGMTSWTMQVTTSLTNRLRALNQFNNWDAAYQQEAAGQPTTISL